MPEGRVVIGPAPEGAESVILLNGDQLMLDESLKAATYCRVPWPFVCRQINLGLDLQGGAFAAYEIDEIGYWETQFKEVEREIEQLYLTLEDERFFNLRLTRGDLVEGDDGGLIAPFTVSGNVTAQEIANAYIYEGLLLGASDDSTLILQLTGRMRTSTLDSLTGRLLDALNTRFDAFGITEPTIRAAGVPGRVFVELPGQVEIPTVQPGQLEFCSVPGDFATNTGSTIEVLPVADPATFNQGAFTSIGIDRAQRCVRTEDISNASPALGEDGGVQVNVQLRPSAATTMNDLTREAWSNRGPNQRFLAVILDGKVLRMDGFEPNLGTSFRIRGVDHHGRGHRAGHHPAFRGASRRNQSNPIPDRRPPTGPKPPFRQAAGCRFGCACCIDLYGYFLWVIWPICQLGFDRKSLPLSLGVMSLVGFTLSLPGIAGIVLTIGMAVDANVLVFERMREVWRKTGNVGQSIENGYSQAFSTILDANVTTMIAAMVLFFVGSGPVQGFALTLWIGVVSSMFCALAFTRMLIGFWHNPRRAEMPI